VESDVKCKQWNVRTEVHGKVKEGGKSAGRGGEKIGSKKVLKKGKGKKKTSPNKQ